MHSHPSSPLRRNIWIYPAIATVIAVSIFQGIRMGQDHREATDERYAAALTTFGRTDGGEAVLDTRRFAHFRHNRAVDDVTKILHDPESNHLAKIQAMEVLGFILGEQAAPLLIEQIESAEVPVRDEAIRILAETGGEHGIAYVERLTSESR